MRCMIISYLPDMSLQPNFQIVPLQLIGIRTKNQLSLLQLLIGALTSIEIKKECLKLMKVLIRKKGNF